MKMKHGAFSDSGAGTVIKKLLNFFIYLYFLYIFTIKIFLKNTLLWHWFTKQRKKKARNTKQNTKEATNIQNKFEE